MKANNRNQAVNVLAQYEYQSLRFDNEHYLALSHFVVRLQFAQRKNYQAFYRQVELNLFAPHRKKVPQQRLKQAPK